MEENLSLDIQELKRLLESAERPRVKKLLDAELQTLLKAQKAAEEENRLKSIPLETKKQTPQISYTTVDSYSWDQEYDKVKIYIFLEGATQEKTIGNLTESSVELKIHDVDGKNLRFSLPRLCKSIVPEKSSFVVKPKRITIHLKKKEGGHWGDVIKKEDKFKPPKLDSDNKDPMSGLMDLMKNMYEEGDDEMKKTIAKAWTESKSGKKQDASFDI